TAGKDSCMKRIASLLVCALMIFGLCSCVADRRSVTDGASSSLSDEASAPSPSTSAFSPSSSANVSSGQDETSGTSDDTLEASSEKPLLWKVSDAGGHELYLFGTIHVGENRNRDVLEALSGVLGGCDALAVEFDVVAYSKDVSAVMRDMTQYVLNDGTLVSDHMPEELYDRAYSLLQRAGLLPSMFTRYNLAWWSQLVDTAMISLYSDLDPELAMDSLLIKRAYSVDLPVLDVESSEFQMSLLNSFDDELYLIQIREALDGADSYGDDLNRMYDLWLSGDREAFWSLISEDENESPEDAYTEEQLLLIADYNRKLLDDRNAGMAEKAAGYLESGKTVFFAVGAAHMAGDAGLVKLLTDAGFSVEQIGY
ncbi:MAG: TraB/GumN family protein, partial [Clostridia bacterium]|nr:TraB/GumN family protein [Clostridia bacterium]